MSAASLSPVQTGKARLLAVLNESRAATLPDVKTVRELGYDCIVINDGSMDKTEDLALLERIDDEQDIKAARKALKEKGGVTLDEYKKKHARR